MTAIDAPLQQPRIAWQTGCVQAIVVETSRVKSIILQPANWSGHWPGQHVDIRLTLRLPTIFETRPNRKLESPESLMIL